VFEVKIYLKMAEIISRNVCLPHGFLSSLKRILFICYDLITDTKIILNETYRITEIEDFQ
jgi:hypothetical protein